MSWDTDLARPPKPLWHARDSSLIRFTVQQFYRTLLLPLGQALMGRRLTSNFCIECLRSILINTHMIEAAYRAGADRYFFSSSACAYSTLLQEDTNARALKESDAYPAMAERGYGWEKLISEMFCQEYWAERGMKTFIARFHNVYGPWGTWDGGREKAPADICRKVIAAVDNKDLRISSWGNGQRERRFRFNAV